MNPNSLVDEIARLALEFQEGFESRFGYPPDEHLVSKAQDDDTSIAPGNLLAHATAKDLLRFYDIVDEISLPDLDNGYFIHPRSVTFNGEGAGHPTEVRGYRSEEICTFGSEGGGALYALGLSTGHVYRLTGGELIGSAYSVEPSGFHTAAPSLWGFLEFLRDRLKKSLMGD
ncbi:hypothetical protein FNX48_021180 [Streptomyces sp. IF17]|nr:hypothetical protein [Streptomyces alkaliphilus]